MCMFLYLIVSVSYFYIICAGVDGELWDYETCSFAIQSIGTNGQTDMFSKRSFSMDWLTSHCASRFDVMPQPRTLGMKQTIQYFKLCNIYNFGLCAKFNTMTCMTYMNMSDIIYVIEA